MAKNLALLGLTDDGIARAMNIAPSNLYAWKSKHPPFRRALDEGREIAHAQVAASLHQKATGFTRIGKKVTQSKAGPVVVEVEEYHPPDTAAASFWLRNRAPDHWKERREVNVEASFEHRFATMTIEERRADARALADEMRRALIEASSTIDGEAVEVVEPPRERTS